MTESVAAQVEDPFLAVVLADEELLRAEFDAIVTAAWPPLTPSRPPYPPSGSARPVPAAQRPHTAGFVTPDSVRWPATARARYRSPPPTS